jgi:hypothetical protein
MYGCLAILNMKAWGEERRRETIQEQKTINLNTVHIKTQQVEGLGTNFALLLCLSDCRVVRGLTTVINDIDVIKVVYKRFEQNMEKREQIREKNESNIEQKEKEKLSPPVIHTRDPLYAVYSKG